MPWEMPITNRTNEDVDRIEEYDEIGYAYLDNGQKAEWLSGMIGALNATDLNRIESNQQFILNLLSGQYHLPFKTNWQMIDFVTENDEKRILNNLKVLMNPFDFDKSKLPETPLNEFNKINTIESVLLDAFNDFNANIEKSNFLTNSDEEFVVSEDEPFVVSDNKLRKEFETNQNEIFKVFDDSELVVFN